MTGQSESGVIGADAAGNPVCLRYEDRTAHVALIGKSRFGKTTVLEHLIREDLNSGTGMIVLDAHGDLTNRIIELAPAAALERMTIVELNTEASFGLNLYECPSHDSLTVDRVVGNVIEIFKKLFLDERNFYPVIEEGLRNSAYVVIANGHTLHEVPLLFTDSGFLLRSLKAVTNRTVLGFWREYGGLPAREKRELSWPVLNKVNRFLTSDAIKYMVAQSNTTIPFAAALERGETLIFRLSGDQLDRETASFLGMVFLASLSNAVAARAGQVRGARRRVHVYLDEYGRFATKTTDRMLEEFGKYEIGLTVAHQNLEQLGGRPASAAALVMFQLDGHDAPKMAQHLDTTPRRTKTVVKPRTEPQYDEESVDRWESPEYEAEYNRLRQEVRDARGEAMDLHGKVPVIAAITLDYDHSYSLDFANSVCDCGRHGLVGGDFTLEYPPRKTDIAHNYARHRMFNPCPLYFTDTNLRRRKAGEMLTASGLVGIFDVEDEPLPGQTSGPLVRCERYFLRPGVVNWSWFAVEIQRAFKAKKAYSWDKPWLEKLKEELFQELRELYKTTPFHMKLAPGVPPVGGERPGTAWMENHWLTAQFPSVVAMLEELGTQWRQRMNEVDELYPRLEARVEELHRTRRSTEVVRTYLGRKRAEDAVPGLRVRDQYSRGGTFQVTEKVVSHEGWYDAVEELDQTHSDRAAEIAAELASLPKYVAYCKLLDPDGNPHEYRVVTRKPAEPVGALNIAAVVERSRGAYGRSWDMVQGEIESRWGGDEEEPPPPVIGRRT